MSNEDMEKRMEFIVEQLADLTVKQQQTDSIVNRLANASLDRIENLENKIEALVDAQIRTEGHVSALVESQLRTDERLNAFVTVVERYISEDRNGKDQG